jgi:uroporphyrinogen-III synthase
MFSITVTNNVGLRTRDTQKVVAFSSAEDIQFFLNHYGKRYAHLGNFVTAVCGGEIIGNYAEIES